MAVAFDHVVLGAAGGTGSAVVRELAARGLRVRAVTRGGTTDTPEGVEQVAADVGTSEGARRASEGAAVVYHCAQPGYTAGSSSRLRSRPPGTPRRSASRRDR